MELFPMSRLVLLGAVAAVTWFGIQPGAASFLGTPLDRAPWCLRYDIGGNSVQENCTLPSFEACYAERTYWGTTAFCSPNPAYSLDWSHEARRKARHRKHRRHYR
jgi:hypothetical protein